MSKVIYLVYQDDAMNADVRVGIYTSREKALRVFREKVEEYSKRGTNVNWVSDEVTRKEVFFEYDAFGGCTWFFDTKPTDEILDLW